VRVYALVSAETEKVIDFYRDEEDALAALLAALWDCLVDEPGWTDILSVSRSRSRRAGTRGAHPYRPALLCALVPPAWSRPTVVPSLGLPGRRRPPEHAWPPA
jgi:hypothetical protein